MDDMTAGIILAGIFGALTVGTVVATITLGGRATTVTKLGVLETCRRGRETLSTEEIIDEELATGLQVLEGNIPHRTGANDESSSNHTAAEQEAHRGGARLDRPRPQQDSDRVAPSDGKPPSKRSPT